MYITQPIKLHRPDNTGYIVVGYIIMQVIYNVRTRDYFITCMGAI